MCGSLGADFQRRQEQQRPANPGEGAAAVWFARRRRGRAFSGSTLPTLLRDLGIAAVPHGFRSSFRDGCGECSDAPREVAEAALAHAVRNKVEAAYARSDLFERTTCPDAGMGRLSRSAKGR